MGRTQGPRRGIGLREILIPWLKSVESPLRQGEQVITSCIFPGNLYVAGVGRCFTGIIAERLKTSLISLIRIILS